MLRVTQFEATLLIYLLAAYKVAADLYDANNEHYHSLCGLYSVAQAPETALPAVPNSVLEKTSAAVEQIKRLIKLVDPRGPDGKEVDATVPTEAPWMNETVELDGEPNGVKYKGLTLPSGVRDFFRGKLSRLLAREERLNSVIKEELGEWGVERPKIFGYMREAKWAAAGDPSKLALDQTRGNACGFGKTNPGSSLLNDIACLCVEGGGNSHTGKLCAGENIDQQWSAVYEAGNFAKHFGAKLLNRCEYGKAGPLTAQNIRRRLNNFTRLLGNGIFSGTLSSGAGIVGKKTYNFGAGGTSGDGACGGSSDSSSNLHEYCVNYLTVVMNAGNLTGIKWYDKFVKTEEALDRLTRLEGQVNQTASQIEEIRQKAWEVYFEAQFAAEKDISSLKVIPGKGKSSALAAETASTSKSPQEDSITQMTIQTSVRSVIIFLYSLL